MLKRLLGRRSKAEAEGVSGAPGSPKSTSVVLWLPPPGRPPSLPGTQPEASALHQGSGALSSDLPRPGLGWV